MVLPPQDGSTPTIPEPKPIGPVEIYELKLTRLFQKVPDDAIDQIQNSCEIVELKAGESLVTSRQGIEYLYIIREGYVSIWMPPSFYPKLKKVFLAWRGPGQIIGELREKGDEPSNTSITTYERCELIQIRLDTFRDLAKTVSLLYENVAYMVLDKMRHEGRRSEVVQMNPALRQVAQTLINLAEDRCANFSFTQLIHPIPGIIHQDELAGYVGITRKSVNKELNELERRGLILNEVKKGSQITIRNVRDLQKLISPEILDKKLRELETI
jgi:CRP-like cAMP-binding protein